MKAIVLTGIGGPEVLQLAEVAKPSPGVNQLLVKLKAVGVNPIDYKLRKTGALGTKAGSILGFDAAGIVEAVGQGVTESKAFKPGDEVFYSPGFGSQGSYAQYHVVDAGIVAHKPKNLSFEEAAAIPVAAMTAYDAIMVRGNVRLGDTVLITAANGGVGSAAVQMCKAAGAYVFATASARSSDFVKKLKPDRLIQYDKEDFVSIIQAEAPQGLDFFFDCVGKDYLSKGLPLMKQSREGGGRMASIVHSEGQLADGYRKNVTIHFTFLDRTRTTLEAVKLLLERNQLKVFIDSMLPLEKAADAHRKLEAGGVNGKIVLQIDS